MDMMKKGYPALVRWSKALKLIDSEQAERLQQLNESQTDSAFKQAFALREALYQIFVATINKTAPPADSLQVLNEAVQEADRHRHLVAHDNSGLTWQWNDQESPAAMLWPIALSAVDLLTADNLDRVRQCPGCGWLFFDQSRNRSRTWCDMQFCGNRSKARRFYQRQKSAE